MNEKMLGWDCIIGGRSRGRGFSVFDGQIFLFLAFKFFENPTPPLHSPGYGCRCHPKAVTIPKVYMMQSCTGVEGGGKELGIRI